MKINLNKSEKLWFVLIGIIIICLPIIFSQTSWIFSFEKTGQIGDTIGGITAPFLSFFGSILVYLALKSQIDANEEFKKQFEKQNQDALFYRLLDNLRDRTINYSINTIGLKNNFKEIKSYEVLSHLVKELKNYVFGKTLLYGKHLVSISPDIIGLDYYLRLLNSQRKDVIIDFSEAESLKIKISELGNYSKRWEFIKKFTDLPSSFSDASSVFRSIGSVYWYKTNLEERRNFYSEAYQNIYSRFGGFLEGYINDINNILKFIKSNSDNNFYIKYLNDTLTGHDKTIIFYYLSNKSETDLIFKFSKEYKLLESLIDNNDFFIDIPSKEEFERELKALFYEDVEWPLNFNNQ